MTPNPAPAPDTPPSVGIGRPPTTMRWAQHWDPHPVCWLAATLRHAPYHMAGLGYRTCPIGGVAITAPGCDAVVGVAPVDEYRVTWQVVAHDPDRDARRGPVQFGRITWTVIDRDQFDRQTSTIALIDGSRLTVASYRGSSTDTRFRIESRAVPGRVVPGTDAWADLAGVELIAHPVHTWLVGGDAFAGGGSMPP